MSRQLLELETILHQLISEHRRLLTHVESHQGAMKAMDMALMNEAAQRQEESRLRIASLESRRHATVAALQTHLRIKEELTLTRLGELIPLRRKALFEMRDELRSLAEQIRHRATVGSRLAGAVLGHLNTVVRVLAGAVEQAGVYTKQGVPRVSARIGVIEAVG
jgi:hypothetical protein